MEPQRNSGINGQLVVHLLHHQQQCPNWKEQQIDGPFVFYQGQTLSPQFCNQSLNVSIRFLKALRKANGIFATDRCRAAGPRFDAVQAAEAARLIARAQNITRSLAGATPS